MIILDTNVISELMKHTPDQSVLDWFAQLDSEMITLTSITIAEIHYGIQSLPKEKRQKSLDEAFRLMITEDFNHLVLDFDQKAAEIYGRLGALARSKGKPVSQSDTMIAAITASYNALLSTRNTKDFDVFGIEMVNPFSVCA